MLSRLPALGKVSGIATGIFAGPGPWSEQEQEFPPPGFCCKEQQHSSPSISSNISLLPSCSFRSRVEKPRATEPQPPCFQQSPIPVQYAAFLGPRPRRFGRAATWFRIRASGFHFFSSTSSTRLTKAGKPSLAACTCQQNHPARHNGPISSARTAFTPDRAARCDTNFPLHKTANRGLRSRLAVRKQPLPWQPPSLPSPATAQVQASQTRLVHRLQRHRQSQRPSARARRVQCPPPPRQPRRPMSPHLHPRVQPDTLQSPFDLARRTSHSHPRLQE